MPKYRSSPDAWPNAGYFLVRFLEVLCSFGIMGTLSYFVYALVKAKLGIPYEFIILYAAAVFSLFNVVTTGVAKCCGALNAKWAIIIDFLALAAYSVAFGLLQHAMGHLVFENCVAGRWGIEGGNGVYVCRLYKATWAFSVTAIGMYVISCLIDIVVIRRVGSHKYVVANPRSMQQTKTYSAPNYAQDTAYGSGGLPSQG